MSIRLPVHRGSTVTVTVAATVLLMGTAGVAAADPPSLNVDPCAATLAAAGLWPGTVGDGDDEMRLVSDAYNSYLSRQPECTARLADR